MKQFLKYTLATITGLLIFSVIGIFLTSAILGTIVAMQEPTAVLQPHSVYRINLSGTLAERTDNDPFTEALEQLSNRSTNRQIGLNDLLANIQTAKENPNIDGIYLYGGNLSAGYASMQEIRAALLDFKSTGKFIIAYADDYTQSNYYLASVADKIYLNPQGSVNWSGLYTTLAFFSRALDKLGIEMQVVKVGTFKSAVEPYILTQMSDANRLQMNSMLQDIWNSIVSDVAQSRSLTTEQLNNYADMNMLFRPAELLTDYGLTDSVVYTQDMKTILEAATGTTKYKLVSHSEMLNLPTDKKYIKDKIAIIYAYGDITDEEGDGIVGKEMVKTIDKVAADSKVKAVVLRVNSPGGSAYASEQIWHALTLLKQQKPLIVSMGDYAASGGYYISCMADTIIAQDNTLTGSIGIFGLIPNISGLTDKLGIDYDGVKTHHLSSLSTDMVIKGMNAEERALMQRRIDRGYHLFVSRCAEGRGMTKKAIEQIAEGRVWSGRRAIEIGLVDKIGTIDDAVRTAAHMANLTTYDIVDYPKQKDSMTQFLEKLSGTSDTEKALLREIQAIEKMIQQPAIQARLPYNLTIH